jgi:carbon-monoxide dehydrogenase large subunit
MLLETVDMSSKMKMIGEPILRKEDHRLVTGKGSYVEDVSLPNMKWMAFLRSPHGHARIKNINTEAAKKHPGVVAVITDEDLRGKCHDLHGLRLSIFGDMQIPTVPVFARNKVWHVGQAIAAVIADERYVAQDATELIEVEYEVLPAVVDAEETMETDAPRLHEEFPDNTCLSYHTSKGDVAQAFEEADVIIREKISNQKIAPAPMEPRACLAHWNSKDETLTVWPTTQGAQRSKGEYVEMLGLPEDKVTVYVNDVGGGFGAKHDDPEYLAVVVGSMIADAPVKWVETRSDNFANMNNARGKTTYIELSAKKDGTLTGMRIKHIGDLGAYLKGPTAATHVLSSGIAEGSYVIPNVDLTTHSVYTNKVPDGAFRGYGRPEGMFVIERGMALLAEKLEMDPAELRLKNYIQKDAFPYKTTIGESYDSGDYQKDLNLALKLSDYKKLRKEQEELRKEGKYIGIGIASYVKSGGAGPHPTIAMGGGWEVARVRMSKDAKVTVVTGTSPHGQGLETTFAQIAAEVLQLPIEDVTVKYGDTAEMPYGLGTFGSRSMAVGGPAVLNASEKIKGKLQKIAAHKLDVAADKLTLESGAFSVKGQDDKTITVKEVVSQAFYGLGLPKGMEPGLDEINFFQPDNITFSFGSYVCLVEVDIDTGNVKPLKFFLVDDPGTIINPMVVDGQTHGGAAMSVGQALYENIHYDSNGQLLSGTFMDYAMPIAAEMPEFITATTETPSPLNPLGAKGFGESTNTGAPPAVVNAVMDALKPLGIKHIQMPLTSEKVWRAIQDAKKGATE